MALSHSPAIVLVDDEPIMLTILSCALDYLAPGYDVIALRDGAAALAYIAQRSVALVITDYHMPGMDGMALIEAIQAMMPACPVGLLTASLTPALAQRAQAAGAVFVLSKPVELAQLATVVQGALRTAGAQPAIPLDLDSPHDAGGISFAGVIAQRPAAVLYSR
jgi:CheY-like chemotaxis protein